eukprot:5231254-Prymnesium_polylepis.1
MAGVARGVPVAEPDPFMDAASAVLEAVADVRILVMQMLQDWEPEMEMLQARFLAEVNAQTNLIRRAVRVLEQRGRMTVVLLVAVTMTFAGGVALVSGVCYLLARAVLFCSARWLRFLMMRHAMRA